MKRQETRNNINNQKREGAGTGRVHGENMVKVLDDRKHPVRALWRRGKTFYAQLRVPGKAHAVRFLLKVDGRPARTVAEAIAARDKLKVERKAGKLSATYGRKPMLKDAIKDYIDHRRKLANDEDAKRRRLLARGGANYVWPAETPKPSHVVALDRLLGAWLRGIGNVRVDNITRPAVMGFLKKLESEGRAGSTINSHLSALSCLLTSLADDGHLAHDQLVTAHVVRRKIKSAPREFLSAKGVAYLVETARRMGQAADILGPDRPEGDDMLRNGAELADLVKLLALSGGRLGETLRLRWRDVDFEKMEVRFGADGLSKNGRPRTVPFNPELAAHLREMHSRRLSDCDWIFPSPKRPKDAKDAEAPHWSNPHKAWDKLRERAARPAPGMSNDEIDQLARLRTVRLHDMRHHHASVAVMAGVDLPTVASLLGHMDGGQLVMKTYGHLADSHRRRMAQRLVFAAPAEAPQLPDAQKEQQTNAA